MGCITKRPANTVNFYSAQRANSVDISDLSGTIGFCSDVVTPPTLFGSALNSTEFSLSWISTGGEIGFKVYRSLTEIGGYSLIDTLGVTNTFTDSGLAPEETYFYKVTSTGISGDSGFSNIVTDTLPVLEAPSLLNLTNVELEEITTNWTSNTGGREDSFRVERSLTSGSGFSEIASVASGVVTYVDDTPPLDHGTAYYYRVRAEASGVFSAYSNEANATTPVLDAPSSFAVSSTIYNKVICTWVSNSGGEEDAFSIERSLTTAVGFSVVGTVATGVLTFTDTTAKGDTEYFYRVRATEAQGNSAYSNEDSLTTTTAMLNLIQPNLDTLTQPNGDQLITDD